MNATLIKLSHIQSSKNNPRKYFDVAKLKELADSIKSIGLAQPILVRALGKDHSPTGTFELEVGERRLRAAKLVNLDSLECIIRDMSDDQALDLQLAENIKRQDITEIEEGDTYRILQDHKKLTVDQIAERVGKSRAHVYGRIKLATLPEKIKKELFKGALSASVALLIARIPDPIAQTKACKEILEEGDWEPNTGNHFPMTYREAKEHIEEDYMIRLKDSSFSQTDPKILPSAGPCMTCPKRTGNLQNLYPDITSTDVCTDPGCYEQKVQENTALQLAAAEKQGHTILPPNKDRFYNGQLRDSHYIDLNDRCYSDDKSRNYRNLLKDHLIHFDSNPVKALMKRMQEIPSKDEIKIIPLVAVDDQGAIHELLPQKVADPLIRDLAKKEKWSSDSYSRSDQEKQHQKENRIKELAKSKLIESLMEKVKQQKFWDWKLIAQKIIVHGNYSITKKFAQIIAQKKEIKNEDKILLDYITKASIPELQCAIQFYFLLLEKENCYYDKHMYITQGICQALNLNYKQELQHHIQQIKNTNSAKKGKQS